MNSTSIALVLFLTGVSAPAFADSVSGPGTCISGSLGGTFPTTMPNPPASASVVTTVPVTGVDSIVLEGFTHSFVGDLHMTLEDPNGVEHNIFVRPGAFNPSPDGYFSPFGLGDYTFVASGAPNDLPTTSDFGGALQPGTYNQTFGTGAIDWVNGSDNVFNTSMCDIQGPAGTWTVNFYDWFPFADFGDFTGWTLNFNGANCPTGFPDLCSGDGGDQLGCTDCPCNNNAAPGTIGGCLNSQSASARLLPSGSDSVTAADLCFEMSGGIPGSFAILTSGSGIAPGNAANPCFAQNPGSGIISTSLDGLRCRIGTVFRHGSRGVDAAGFVGPMGPAPNGAWGFCSANFPNFVFAAGDLRYFQIFYREDPLLSCGTSLNTSQAVQVTLTL